MLRAASVEMLTVRYGTAVSYLQFSINIFTVSCRIRAAVIIKYCDDCICVCVCMFTRILRNDTFDLYQFLRMLPIAVDRSSSSRVTKFQREGAIFRVFFPNWHFIIQHTFGTHTKTAEPIEMPFGIMSGLVTLRWRFPKGRDNFWETSASQA